MQDVIDDFDRLYQLAVETSGQARCEAGHEQHLYGMLLYGNLLESISGAAAMLRAGNHSPLRGLGRSVLEAYLDLQNLCAQRDYVPGQSYDYLDKMQTAEVVMMLEGCEAFLEKKPGHAHMAGVREDLMQLLTAFNAQDRNCLGARQRFALAGVPEDWYYNVYLNVCGAAHMKLAQLWESIVTTEDGCAVKLFRQWPQEELLCLVRAMCHAVMAGLGVLRSVGVAGIDYGDVLHQYRCMLKYWPAEEDAPAGSKDLVRG